jgi:putative oxidoreductase
MRMEVRQQETEMKDLGLLILRLVGGGLLAGHGAQKLFGWFGGGGIEGTAGMMQGMNLKPPKPWAMLAGASEFGGGLLTALGALGPVGPVGTIGAMEMATLKAHWGKPIWNTKGGAELPVLNMAFALAVALLGPGKYSVDGALGWKIPRRLVLIPGLLLAGAGVAAGVIMSNRPQPQPEAQAQEQAQVEEPETAVRVPASAPARAPGEWAAMEQQSEEGQSGEAATEQQIEASPS